MPPDGAVPIMFEVGQVVGRFDEWGSLAGYGIGDPYAIRGGAKANLLLHDEPSVPKKV